MLSTLPISSKESSKLHPNYTCEVVNQHQPLETGGGHGLMVLLPEKQCDPQEECEKSPAWARFCRTGKKIKDGPSAKELKDLGNKLFAAKKYDDSIRVFSKAITSSDSEETPLLKAMCFQNRAAAKEHHGGFTIEDMLSDCQQALKYNPRYAKAYFRKARLLEMKKDYEGSLVCVFCATQLDSSLDTQTGQILSVLLEQLEKRAYQTWQLESHSQQSVKHVRHEKVYIWLHKTVVSDCIRSDVLSRRISEDT
ncbi:hypothetical protein Aduo_018983 [Ancylostoma duodenale]